MSAKPPLELEYVEVVDKLAIDFCGLRSTRFAESDVVARAHPKHTVSCKDSHDQNDTTLFHFSAYELL